MSSGGDARGRWVGIGGGLVLTLVAILALAGAASTNTHELLIGRPEATSLGISLRIRGSTSNRERSTVLIQSNEDGTSSGTPCLCDDIETVTRAS